MKLWQKEHNVNKDIESFTVGDDYIIDENLLFWDCVGSLAHASMLKKIGIITEAELAALKSELRKIVSQVENRTFKIRPDQEDCHTAIENHLIEKLGDVGKKIHTGRSRNDQVLTAIKLYTKNALLDLEQIALEFCSAALEFSKRNNIPFPGYTHMQKAMPSTVALWASSFVESMLDNIKLLVSIREILDKSPLGAAAGYGVSFPLDREYSASLMGFSEVQGNVIYAQNSRGKNEGMVLSACTTIMGDLNKLATDLILFSMDEFKYFELPIEFCTGSSIMPQKKNPDVFELLRAKSHVVNSLYSQVTGIIQSLPSGYNRDFQLTKKPLFEGVAIVSQSLNILVSVFKNLKVNKERCLAGLTKEIFATDIANELVMQGMPFRDAYKKVGTELDSFVAKDPQKYIDSKTHIGAPGNPGLESLGKRIIEANNATAKSRRNFDKAIEGLVLNK